MLWLEDQMREGSGRCPWENLRKPWKRGNVNGTASDVATVVSLIQRYNTISDASVAGKCMRSGKPPADD